ncbi:DUF2577 domain-containing protein [Anaerocolumna sp. AGMB13020]|uniref:DUF2577 domain-containing protein n=1 Tax=Anaerocolumna sp. AGMB13020 TaxID=3081750 RepID=UPI002953DC9C|nr:DUF2577 domain-containing protein [Anaerocolumna sp. AGMB13020]WOO35411.1 DUF2577 domain-containing protein [Anaerocolumna sp. AGMB13020]
MASEGLIPLLKRVALEAVDASKPTVVLYGTVSGINPLTIYLEQKRTITRGFLVVTDKVKNLVVGDKVVMIRMQGGQKYIIMDKVVSDG